ncbi:MAG: type I restriction-modification enzyme R subunit C-terminal domain-containing protein, partial [Thermoplasmata archaeon]
DDLEWMDERRALRKPLSVELINTEIVDRDFQIAAIRAVLEGVEAKRRKFLLVMATGTGKTRTATALIDVLRRAKWAILGLEKLVSWSETVSRAFDQFIAEHNTFSATQIRFLQTLKTFILQTGRVERRDLIEAPFTQLHPYGIRGLFQAGEIEEILAFSDSLVA